MGRVALIYIFANCFNIWLNRSWILIPTWAFNLLQYVVLVKIYKENQALHLLGKRGKNILTVSSNCVNCSLIRHQNLTSDSFFIFIYLFFP